VVAAFAGLDLAGQAATTGSPTLGSSFKGAMVTSVMQRARGTAHSEELRQRADDCRLVGKDADDFGAPLDLAVEALDRIGDRQEDRRRRSPWLRPNSLRRMVRPSGTEATGAEGVGRPIYSMS